MRRRLTTGVVLEQITHETCSRRWLRRHPATSSTSVPEPGVQVTDVYVRADGARLGGLVEMLAQGLLSLHLAATPPLAEAATALQDAVAGRASGAIVLMLQPSPS